MSKNGCHFMTYTSTQKVELLSLCELATEPFLDEIPADNLGVEVGGQSVMKN